MQIRVEMTGEEYLSLHRREHPKKSHFFKNLKSLLSNKTYVKIVLFQCAAAIVFISAALIFWAVHDRDLSVREHELGLQQHTFSTPTTTYTFDTDFYNTVKAFVMFIGIGLCVGWSIHGVGFTIIRR